MPDHFALGLARMHASRRHSTCRKSTGLSLSPGAATPLSTWLIQKAPGLLMSGQKAANEVPVTFKASQGAGTGPQGALPR